MLFNFARISTVRNATQDAVAEISYLFKMKFVLVNYNFYMYNLMKHLILNR